MKPLKITMTFSFRMTITRQLTVDRDEPQNNIILLEIEH